MSNKNQRKKNQIPEQQKELKEVENDPVDDDMDVSEDEEGIDRSFNYSLC